MGGSIPRSLIGASFVVAFALTISGCASDAKDASESLTEGLTSDALCDIADEALAPIALPSVRLDVGDSVDNGSTHWCTLSDPSDPQQLVRVVASYGNGSVDSEKAINAAVTDGSDNSKEQCPGGSSLPAVSAGVPEETALLCTKEDRTVFAYMGGTTLGTFSVRVQRTTAEGAMSLEEAQSWIDAVAARVLSAQDGGSTDVGAPVHSLSDVIGAWVAPPIPDGWHAVGTQPRVNTFDSVFEVFDTLSSNPCRQATAGLSVVPTDKGTGGEIALLAALGTSELPSAPGELAATARAFPSPAEANKWLEELEAVIVTCNSDINAPDAGFFSLDTGVIRWAGDSIRSQPSAGFVKVIGNTVFSATATADATISDQESLDSWVSAIEQSAQAAVN